MPSNRFSLGALARVSVTLLGVLLLLVFYFWTHKPFELDTFSRLGGAALDGLTVGALFAVAGALGRRVVRLLVTRLSLDVGLLSRAERFALETAFGLMLIAIATLALGMVGLFRSVFFWVPLFIIGLLLWREVDGWFADIRALVAGARPQTRWGWLLAAFTVAMLGLALLHALAPVYAWDAMTYHLVGPARYLADGAMSPSPYNFYLGFPKNTEMLYSVTMSLFGRDTAAAPVHYGYGLLALLTVAGAARRATGSIEAGWLAAALLIGSFSLWLLMGWPYVDLGVLLMSALAFSLLNVWRETKDPRWLVIVGLVCGFGMGIKLTSGLLVAALGLSLLVYQPRQIVRNGVLFGVAVTAAFLPWLIRGALHYGNPIYPYLFDGLNWEATRMMMFNQAGQGLIKLNQGWQIPLLPFTATIFGVEFTEPYGFTVSPWLFTLPFLLPLFWKWVNGQARAWVWCSLVVIVPLFIVWGIMAANAGIAMQTRLMIVIFPPAALLGTITLHAIGKSPVRPIHLDFIVRVVVGLTLVLCLKEAVTRFDQMRVGSYFLSAVTRDEYLFLELATYPATMARLGELPADSQVRFLWEPRSYYCPETITCIPDVLFDEWGRPISQGATPEALLARWREQGDDYVLFFRHGYNAYLLSVPYNREINALVDPTLAGALDEVWTTPDGRYVLYTWPDER